MKLSKGALSLVISSSILGYVCGTKVDQQSLLRPRKLQRNNSGISMKRMKKPCTFIIAADTRLSGKLDPDESYLCVVDPSDSINGQANQAYEIEMDESQKQVLREKANDGQLVSGKTRLEMGNVNISFDEKVHLPQGEAVAFGGKDNGEEEIGRRKLATKNTGNRSILVVKVFDENDLARPESPEQISDDIFGTINDPINIKSQLHDCSYGQLNIEPGSSDHNEAEGVTSVNINIDITDSTDAGSRYWVRNAITSAVQTKLGFSLPGPYDHVWYVLEKCYHDCGWAAYAYVNSWNQVYQSVYYKYAAVQIHEHGHNMGLAHSGGLNGQPYTDHTCTMGNPLYGDDQGKICFNPAKNWDLGWYKSHEKFLDPKTETSWTGRLVGIADYCNNSDNHAVIVKIETGTNTDQFIGFNRATGINSQNDEADNEVTIIETGNNGQAYSQSFLKAHLQKNELYIYPNWAGTGTALTIEALDIDLAANPAYADVSIRFGNAAVTSPSIPSRSSSGDAICVTPSPTLSPTPSPTSQPPTPSPTSLSPTKNPTTSPTSKPSLVPTTNPTTSPVTSPTPLPTPSPTTAPTPSPTTSVPTLVTTSNPSLSPTIINPTLVPTPSPTTGRTPIPTPSPTTAPTPSPTTSVPTLVPTPSPTTGRTPIPTPSPTTAPTPSPTTSVPTLVPTPSPTTVPTPEPSPSPTTAPTSPPTVPPTTTSLSYSTFENGWGGWKDGGRDARRNKRDRNDGFCPNRSWCIRLRDNTNQSTMTLENLNVAPYDQVNVAFTYKARSMERGEDFWLQISSDGGSTYTTVETWAQGSDFTNGSIYSPSVIVDTSSASNINVRFRCDASGRKDYIYIDNVNISA